MMQQVVPATSTRVAALVVALLVVAVSASDAITSTCDSSGDAPSECARQPVGRSLLQQAAAGKAPGAIAVHAAAVGGAAGVGSAGHLALFTGKKAETASKFAELERTAKAMHASGQEPMGIANWVKNQLLPLANATRQEMQVEIDHAQQTVHACSDARTGLEQGITQEETTLSIGEARVNECVLLRDQKKSTSDGNCERVQHLCDSITGPVDLEANATDSNATDDDDEVGNMLKRNYQFFQDMYPRYMEKDHACTQATQATDAQGQLCEQDKAGIEASYCALLDARQQACLEYSECFQTQSELFTRIKTDVQLLEAHTKETFKTLSCFGQTLLQGMPGVAPACDPENVDVTHLDVFYPSVPVKDACSDVVQTSWDYAAVKCGPDEAATTTVDSVDEVGAADDKVGTTAAATDNDDAGAAAPIEAAATTPAPVLMQRWDTEKKTVSPHRD